MSRSVRTSGVVKWFDSRKGFGFITAADQDRDIFVHFSGIVMDGFRKLREGDAVEFELAESDKGLQAVNVVRQGGGDA